METKPGENTWRLESTASNKHRFLRMKISLKVLPETEKTSSVSARYGIPNSARLSVWQGLGVALPAHLYSVQCAFCSTRKEKVYRQIQYKNKMPVYSHMDQAVLKLHHWNLIKTNKKIIKWGKVWREHSPQSRPRPPCHWFTTRTWSWPSSRYHFDAHLEEETLLRQ